MNSLDLSHLAEKARATAELSDEARFRSIMTERFVHYPRATELLNHAEYLIRQPRQTRAWGVTIMGIAGSGKTSIAEAVKRLGETATTGDKHRVTKPVVMISMTEAREARAIYNRILTDLGAPVPSSMRVADREEYAMRIMTAAQTKLLVVDEIQDILQITKRQQRAALDTIKLIMNTLHIPIIAFGVPSAAEAMAADEHLYARFDFKALPAWKVGNANTEVLLMGLEATLPLRKASYLSSPAMQGAIVKPSKGLLARIVRTVKHAAIFAILDKEERITRVQIERATREIPPAWTLGQQGQGPDGEGGDALH